MDHFKKVADATVVFTCGRTFSGFLFVASLLFALAFPQGVLALKVGDHVEVNAPNFPLNIRNSPRITDENIVGKAYDGATGIIVGGPRSRNGFTWWWLCWDDSPFHKGQREGWSANVSGNSLVKITAPTPTPIIVAKKDRIVEVLFDLSSGQADAKTFHDYNDYGNCPDDWCDKPKSGYKGGHAGWDVQTKSVAGDSTDNELFYSLTSGRVIKGKEKKDNWGTIAVYDSVYDKTTLYLHSRRIAVSAGQFVNVGDSLGIQGNYGLHPAPNENKDEHVHIEVIIGQRDRSSNGKGASQSTRSPTIDPVPYLYESIISTTGTPTPTPDRLYWKISGDITGGPELQIVAGDSTEMVAEFSSRPFGTFTFSIYETDWSRSWSWSRFRYDYRLVADTSVAPVSVSATNVERDGGTYKLSTSWKSVFSVGEEPDSPDRAEYYFTVGQDGTVLRSMLDDANRRDNNKLYPLLEVVRAAPKPNAPVAEDVALVHNYPNPFNSTTTIKYVLPQASMVRLEVFNIAGQMVRTLVADRQEAGHYAVRWDATADRGHRVSSGIYFYRLQAGSEFVEVKKMLMVR